MIAAQAGVMLVAAAISAMAGGAETAAASGLGGLACLLPQAWFAWRVFRVGAGDSPQAMLAAFYQGEVVKLALVAIALVAIFRAWPGVPLAPLVLTFMAVQAVHWFAPLLLER
ncbi:MAG: ATP synthase subunit I [Halofilum sp. (in: g-proteobacteria)]|nr:ATP synthase subunit I [Halofilum sp. (in: g-proteobacteria)]